MSAIIYELMRIHISFTQSGSWLEFTNTFMWQLCAAAVVRVCEAKISRPRYRIFPFWNIIKCLTQAPQWCSASRLFAALLNMKGLGKAFNAGHTQFRDWAAERRDKEAIFDDLRRKRAGEDIQSLQGNARKLSVGKHPCGNAGKQRAVIQVHHSAWTQTKYLPVQTSPGLELCCGLQISEEIFHFCPCLPARNIHTCLRVLFPTGEIVICSFSFINI